MTQLRQRLFHILHVLLFGAALSAVVGYFSLALLVKALKGKWFWLFGPYCLVAGLLTLVFARGA